MRKWQRPLLPLSCLLVIAISIPGIIVGARQLVSDEEGLLSVAEAQQQIIQGDPVYSVLPPDRIRSIDHPQFVPVGTARMRDEAHVIALTVGKETHLYNVLMLNAHEIVNDIIAGDPVAVTW